MKPETAYKKKVDAAYDEFRPMWRHSRDDILGSRHAFGAGYRAGRRAAPEDTEKLGVFITKLVKRCYKLGHRSKLTDDAMNYINRLGLECNPESKLLRKILGEK